MHAMNLDDMFSGGILQSMGDGVLVLRYDGSVAVANKSAGVILGIDVQDRAFVLADIMEREAGNDGFVQVLLDSIYEGVTIQDRIADFIRPDGEKRKLSVTASHLRDEQGRIQGAFIILKDMTEVESLRQSEQELNEELKKALRLADEKTDELNSALKHGQKFRLWLTVGILLLFVCLGVYHWGFGSGRAHSKTAAPAGSNGGLVTVSPRPLNHYISISGTVAPLEEVVFTAPFQGIVKALNFHYGEHVKSGQVLLELGASDMEAEVRKARAEYIKARKQFVEMKHWGNAVEVSRARREVAKAKSQLEMTQSKAAEDKKLYEQGVIPKMEYDNTLQELRGKKMQYAASRESLNSVLSKGDAEYLEISRMEMENAEAKLKAAETKLAQAKITASVSGVAIRPSAVPATDEHKLAVGIVVNEGQPLVSIGSLAGLSIVSQVDELDINNLNKGQPVKVSGDSFPDVTLKGRIDQISSQASDGQVPTFTATIRLTDLPENVGEKVRLGMTANMQVETYSNPNALLVPIAAVITKGGKNFLRVKGKDGVEERAVETGHTSLSDVEILSGLKAGETVQIGDAS
ncbi:efflux RND transporter periplasmic adaptor subunit [Maridesulfovibrio sp.]|uniref:efflux RND transporter periplasmic adaptor subunit n=1 Tax=Maridesulfovibrio sp. TaxID=2795000 RepID=UPI002A18B282|nr:efflux RND transporter periplasmic adaptor subunit [Maridesulfovibrio sp.]